jgi:Icc protein
VTAARAAMLVCQISDMHVMARGEIAYGVVDTAAHLQRCVAHILALKQRPDVVVMTGDLTESGAPAEYAHLRELIAPLTMPVYLIPGNHDERGALIAAFADHAYLGQFPPYVQYAIEDHALRIVAIDTVVPGEGRGELCEKRLAWLARTLAAQPQRATLLIMHHPPFASGIGYMDDIALAAPEALEQIVARHPEVERVLCGHLHRSIQTRFAGTIACSAPSTAHQIALDLARDATPAYTLEPPGYLLHAWSAASGMATHAVSIGKFDGPYTFGKD